MPGTRRQGVEAKLSYQMDRFNAYANYTYVDATYQSPLTISSPNNPDADANGNIFVVPGDHIPAIPNYRFKVGGEYDITDAWKFGADLNVYRPAISHSRRLQPEPASAGLLGGHDGVVIRGLRFRAPAAAPPEFFRQRRRARKGPGIDSVKRHEQGRRCRGRVDAGDELPNSLAARDQGLAARS